MKIMAAVTGLQAENPNFQTNTKHLSSSVMLSLSLVTMQAPRENEELERQSEIKVRKITC